MLKKLLIAFSLLCLIAPSVTAQNPGDIAVVEIMKDPSMSGSLDSLGEWFELYNKTGSPIDINGWILYDKDFDRDTIVNGGPLLVPAAGYLVLGSNSNINQNGGYVCNYQYRYSKFKLGNTDDEIILKTPGGVVIDSVRYTDGPVWPDPTGGTLAFSGCPWQDNLDSNLWRTSTVREPNFNLSGTDKGSPGTRGINQSAGATSINAVGRNATCNGANNGSIDLTISGCAAPFQVLWQPGGQTTEDIQNLSPGTYICRVTDSLLNILYDTVVISQPVPLTSSGIATDALCPSFRNGTVNLTDNGGTPPYRYTWSNGATTQDLNNVAAGTYVVTIRDTNNCQLLDTFTVISQPNTLTATFSVTPASCPNFTNGVVDMTPGGGIQPYSYAWSNNATTQDITGLVPNDYIVTVTDNQQCTFTDTVTVGVIAGSMLVQITVTDATCPDWTNGAVATQLTGGTGPFTWSWSNGANSPSFVNASPGWYRLNLTDGTGCTLRDSAFVDSIPNTLTASAVATPVTCFGGNNGAVALTVSGGTRPHSYLWSNGAATQNLSGLTAGAYSVEVTDSNGCTAADTATVGGPSSGVSVSTTSTPVTGSGGNGSATATAGGGTPPYSYAWSPGGMTGSTVNNLSSGNYVVTVTDSSGCTGLDTVFVDSIPTFLTPSLHMQAQLWPNPAAETFRVSLPAGEAVLFSVEVFNLLGEVQLQKTEADARTLFPVRDLAPGMYWVKVTAAEGVYAARLLVTRR